MTHMIEIKLAEQLAVRAGATCRLSADELRLVFEREGREIGRTTIDYPIPARTPRVSRHSVNLILAG